MLDVECSMLDVQKTGHRSGCFHSQTSADAYVRNVSKPLINTNGHGCRGAAVTGNE